MPLRTCIGWDERLDHHTVTRAEYLQLLEAIGGLAGAIRAGGDAQTPSTPYLERALNGFLATAGAPSLPPPSQPAPRRALPPGVVELKVWRAGRQARP